MQGYKAPKDSDRYRWTNHVQRKMLHYRLTPSRVLRIVRAPERIEEGVAPGTLAGMQKSGSPKRPSEIWAMWREDGTKSAVADSRKIIITAWRYPGTSPVRGAVPIPSDVLAELEREGEL